MARGLPMARRTASSACLTMAAFLGASAQDERRSPITASGIDSQQAKAKSLTIGLNKTRSPNAAAPDPPVPQAGRASTSST